MHTRFIDHENCFSLWQIRRIYQSCYPFSALALSQIEPECCGVADYVASYRTRRVSEEGVGLRRYLIGHHESGGNVPEYESQLKDAFKLYESLGIQGVKTGYAGQMHPKGQHHHGQWNIRHYRKVVEEAAKHKIMTNTM